jgi:hypothetical protein
MRAIIGVAALVLAASAANAAPIYLSCEGDWWVGDGSNKSLGQDAFSLVVDFDKKTVTYGGWTLIMFGNDPAQIFASTAPPFWRYVRLDRVTGHVAAMIDDHPGVFGGTCKPAQKLF